MTKKDLPTIILITLIIIGIIGIIWGIVDAGHINEKREQPEVEKKYPIIILHDNGSVTWEESNEL